MLRLRQASTEYDDEYPTCEETYAELRIYHEDLDPSIISRRLGLTPTKAQKKGEIQNPYGRHPRTAPISGWFLSSREVISSRDCRRHIDWLLEQLAGKAKFLQELRDDGCITDINVYWVSKSGQGGPMIWSSSLSLLADIGADLGFSIYFYGDDDQPQRDRNESVVPHIHNEEKRDKRGNKG